MTTAVKTKGYPDVHSIENWKYTTTNNIKNFKDKDEAKRFISGTGRIWKLDTYANGELFITNLLKSIDELHGISTNGFEYTDDKGDPCYILFLIQLPPDGRSVQISHTQHKLTRSGARRNASDNVQIEESNAKQWLMQRACDELRLPEKTTKALMNPNCNAIEHRPGKYTSNERKLSASEVNRMTDMTETPRYFGEHQYSIMHKSRHGKQFFYGKQEVANFCKHIEHSEEFLQYLTEQIQNVNQPKELVYEVQFSSQEFYILKIVVMPEKDIVHMFMRLETGSM
ncbi:unnamed protein product [Rotaria magnacalcarata]